MIRPALENQVLANIFSDAVIEHKRIKCVATRISPPLMATMAKCENDSRYKAQKD